MLLLHETRITCAGKFVEAVTETTVVIHTLGQIPPPSYTCHMS